MKQYGKCGLREIEEGWLLLFSIRPVGWYLFCWSLQTLDPAGKLDITSLFINDYPFWAKPFFISLAYISSKLEDLENVTPYDHQVLMHWKPLLTPVNSQVSPELPHLYLAKEALTSNPRTTRDATLGSSSPCEDSPWRFWTAPSHLKGTSLFRAPFPACRQAPCTGHLIPYLVVLVADPRETAQPFSNYTCLHLA